MTHLRDRMIEDMKLHGFSPRTQEGYVGAVRQLAKYWHKPPDQISEEELRQYFLWLMNEKKAARSTCTVALTGINPSTSSGQVSSMKELWEGSGRHWRWFDRGRRRNYRWCLAWKK
jgi:hypothetical protein